VLEKPIGYDITSANEINEQVARYFDEQAIYRIDHYLGKETVQNLMALRFSNVLFEELWNNKTIDHVQISLAETVGLESRAGFYDQAGALRDMVQNHLLQLLCLVAMEPPHKLDAENIRAEKLKVLKSLKPITTDNVDQATCRGQYVSGVINNKRVPGYLDELDEKILESKTETFVALRVDVCNWRWSGVPFYVRTGKRLKQRFAEVVVQFKPVSHDVFDASVGKSVPNRLIIRLQPDESIQMTLMVKELNRREVKLKEVALNLNFGDEFEGWVADSYQRLLLEVVEGDPSLFIHRDEVEQAWAWINPILDAWQAKDERPEAYYAGSWGPDNADELVHLDGREWLHPEPIQGGSRL
jgi:glucose-6-phosphate 1-dehydrogenase